MKDKFRMEAEEEKYQELHESVAEMKRMKAEKFQFQEFRDSIAAKIKDELRIETEHTSTQKLLKDILIKLTVILSYVSSH